MRYSAPRSCGPVNFVRRNALAAITLLVVVGFGYAFEHYKEFFPQLVTLQLKAHAAISNLEARKPRNERVVMVEIDDETFFRKLGGITPTSRAFLAGVTRISAEAGAAVVAIDMDLTKEPADDGERKEVNHHLLDAINTVTANGTPVVLTCGLYRKQGTWVRAPDIYNDSNLSAGVRVGYDNLPEDRRRIPLVVSAREENSSTDENYSSFALQIVDAYE